MLKFENTQTGAKISYNGKKIFSIKKGDYLCTLGKGRNDYAMWHGSFKIKEHIYFKNNFIVKNIETDCNKIFINSSDIQFIIETENDSRLKFTPIVSEEYNRLWIKIPSAEDEYVYGCGETFTEFNLRGKKVNIWVAEHINALQTAKKIVSRVFGVKNTTKKQKFSNYETYYAEPTFLSSEKYYFHSETTARSEFDFTDKKYHYIKTDSISPFYIGFGNDFSEVLMDMTDLLGRQPALPDWVFDGAILGIQGGTDIMIKKIDECIKADSKICGVWIQDWEGRRVTAVGKQLQWNWQWDKELYPDLDKKIAELNSMGIKVLGYINPFLAVEKPLYEEAHKNGYCVKDQNGNDYYVKITTFPAAMVDLTNPDAYEWLKNIIKTNMIAFGFSGWMADFGEYLPTDSVLFSGENPETIHNTWPARWAKLNREAVEESGKLGEIMFFTRAGFTETKRYSTMMWNGDNHVDYSIDFGLPSVIPASLSLTCCCFGLSHSDIGGYTTFLNLKRSDELFMRWCEMNAFTPLLRGHEGLNPDANAQFDYNNIVLKHHARMSRIHSALKPYLKKYSDENSKTGIGMIRPLFFHYESKRDFEEAYEYLLGRDLLVAPVLTADTQTRKVYLPDDDWVHLWSANEYKGGTYEIKAPLGAPPVFIRKKSEYLDLLSDIKNI